MHYAEDDEQGASVAFSTRVHGKEVPEDRAAVALSAAPRKHGWMEGAPDRDDLEPAADGEACFENCCMLCSSECEYIR